MSFDHYLFQLHQYVHIIKKRGKERGKNVRSVGKVAKGRKKVADKNCEKEGKRGGRKKKADSLQMQVSMVLFSSRRGQGREFHRDCCNSIAVMRDARIGNVTNHRGESCLAIKLGTGSVLGRVPSPLVQLHPSTSWFSFGSP